MSTDTKKTREGRQKNSEHYIGAVVCGLGVVLPHHSQPGMFVLPGGRVCGLMEAKRVAQILHHIQTNNTRGTDHVV